MKKPKNQQKKAVALGYDPDKNPAPEIIAKGKGKTAERIIDVAKEHDIAFYEDSELVGSLESLDIGESVPEELYNVVAQVLAFVYMVDKNMQKKLKK